MNRRDEIELAMQQVRTQDARTFSLSILSAVQICLVIIISYDSNALQWFWCGVGVHILFKVTLENVFTYICSVYKHCEF